MKKTFLMLSLIAMALIGCGPINGPINPNENNDTIPTDSVVVPFEIWLDTTYDNVTATNPAAITLDGTYKYNGFSHFYDNLLSITFKGGNHFEGRTISNVFSGEYVISGNDVLITHIRCSQFGEKATEANVLHSFVVGGFTATATADGIILSNGGKQLEFINIENEEQYPAEYSYYSYNYWGEDKFQLLTGTITPGYIGVRAASHLDIIAMEDTSTTISNYFGKYGIVVDTQKKYDWGHVQYSTWVVLPVLGVNTIEETFNLVRNFPTDNSILSAVVCFVHPSRQHTLDAFTNEITFDSKKGVGMDEIIEFLDINGIQRESYDIHKIDNSLSEHLGYGDSGYLTFKNIDTGVELISVASILSNWNKIEDAEMNLCGRDYLW